MRLFYIKFITIGFLVLCLGLGACSSDSVDNPDTPGEIPDDPFANLGDLPPSENLLGQWKLEGIEETHSNPEMCGDDNEHGTISQIEITEDGCSFLEELSLEAECEVSGDHVIVHEKSLFEDIDLDGDPDCASLFERVTDVSIDADDPTILTGTFIQVISFFGECDGADMLTFECVEEGSVTGEQISDGGESGIDSDNDGIIDDDDNCPLEPNEDQSDIDDDGFGDVCDEDIDDDTVLNELDNCQYDSNLDQSDVDGDGMGDVCDDDADDDSVLNEDDNCVLDANTDQLDTDGDEMGDVCDSDMDNDGLCDKVDDEDCTAAIDHQPLIANDVYFVDSANGDNSIVLLPDELYPRIYIQGTRTADGVEVAGFNPTENTRPEILTSCRGVHVYGTDLIGICVEEFAE